MDTRQAVADRILELCNRQNLTPNALSYRAGIPQSTVKSILNGESKNPGIVTLKKICDGLDISLPLFFDTPVFWNLEQEME